EAPDDRLADVVFDATGNAAAMGQSVARVEHGGRLVFVGLVQSPVSIDDPLFHRREMTLFATRNSAGDFPRIIQMIEQGRVDTAPWITHRCALSEVPSLFPASIAPRLVEILKERGIENLYVHQARASELASEGKNVVVVTPTASGKTLCYNLPILNALVQDPEARALYLFPTKALAQDQLVELQ